MQRRKAAGRGNSRFRPLEGVLRGAGGRMAETPTHSLPSCWPALQLGGRNMSILRSLLLAPVDFNFS